LRPNEIVINAIPLLSKLTGVGRYELEICKRISRMDPNTNFNYFYGYFTKKLYMTDMPPSGRFAKQIKNVLSRYHYVKKTTRESLLFLSRFSLKTFDLYWEPNIVPIEHIRSRYVVTTMHDFSFQHYPECLPQERMEYLQKHFWKKIGNSDRIITGSHFVKAEIADQLHYDAACIEVIYHGIDHECFKRYDHSLLREFSVAHGLPEKFILFVGSIEPRKNLKNALLAYNSLPEAFKKEYKFVLAGFSGWNNEEIMSIIRREKQNIAYLGYLSDMELAYLFNLASLFLYPSLYEGFGLPPLEAMASGTPVIVSNSSSMPEVCKDAAYYIDSHSVESIREGIVKVVSDSELRNTLSQRGLDRVKLFNWDTSARKHLSLFNEVLRT
jgi:glycosyltransferase involved in cell wall biosynthesis